MRVPASTAPCTEYLELFGLKWERKEITKMIYIHWIFNFIIVWNVIFFVY